VPRAALPNQESFRHQLHAETRPRLETLHPVHDLAQLRAGGDVLSLRAVRGLRGARGLVNLGGKVDDVSWGIAHSLAFVDGNREAPYYGVMTVPGTLDGVPAIGGIPVRDRREQFIYRGGLKVTIPAGKFFVRPVLAAYVHDFQTVQRLNGKSFRTACPIRTGATRTT